MGRLSASGAGGASSDIPASSKYVYNEVTNVTPGIETTISTYTAISGKDCFLQSVEYSGTNIATFRVYINGTVVDKQYTYFTYYNGLFQYLTGNSTSPGISLNTGDVVLITGIQNRSSTCDFNANIQILEVQE